MMIAPLRSPFIGGPAPIKAVRTAQKLAGFANQFITRIDIASESCRYLDVGCGNGFITGYIARNFPEAYAIDAEPAIVKRFKKQMEGDDKYHISTMSAANMSFADARFQFITSFEVLEHLSDLEESADEMVRVLSPGGILVVSVPQVWFPIENHGIHWRGRDIERKIPFLPWFRPLHRRYSLARVFSSRELNRLFTSRGLNHLETKYAAPQFERAGSRPGNLEYSLSLLRPLLNRCEKQPVLRLLIGVSILKAFQKPVRDSY